MEQLNDLDYENIENAVMETARGRWFLSEYKKRNSAAGTPTILEAIARLEKVVREIGNVSDNHKPADIAEKPEPAKPANFETAATKSASAKTVIAPLPQQPDVLTDDNLQFFANDEDLFADSAPAAPAAESKDTPVTTTFAPMEAKPEKPASERFKVFHTADSANNSVDEKEQQPDDKPALNAKADQPLKADAEPVPAQPEVPDPAMTATNHEKDRIVVIRNTASSDIEIPLADEDMSTNTKSADA